MINTDRIKPHVTTSPVSATLLPKKTMGGILAGFSSQGIPMEDVIDRPGDFGSEGVVMAMVAKHVSPFDR